MKHDPLCIAGDRGPCNCGAEKRASDAKPGTCSSCAGMGCEVCTGTDAYPTFGPNAYDERQRTNEAQCERCFYGKGGVLLNTCDDCARDAREQRTSEAPHAHDFYCIESDDQADEALMKCRECGIEQTHKLQRTNEAMLKPACVACGVAIPEPHCWECVLEKSK